MPKFNKSIKVNAMMNALLQVVSVAFPLLTFPYVSRILLPDGVGKVSFANSIISYFIMFAQLGMPTYGIRACARVRDDKDQLSKTVQELLIINIVTTLISYAAFLLVLFTVPRLYYEKTLFLVMSVNIVFSAIGVEWLYKAMEAYGYITLRSIVFKLISLACVFMMIHSKDDYIIYGGLSVLAAVGSNILNLINIRKYVSFKPYKDYVFKPHVKAVLVFFAMSCATTVYLHLDSAMLGFMTSDATVGCYDTAVKVRTVLMHLVTALGVVILPRASYYVKSGNLDQFYSLTEKALNFVLLLASAMTVYFMIFAKESIYLLAGTEFQAAIIPMQIIMPTLLLVGITNITGTQVLVPLGKEKFVLVSVVTGALVDVIFNALLIPHIGASGAAIGTLIAELTVFIVQFSFSNKHIRDMFKRLCYVDTLIGLAAGSVCSFWVKFLPLHAFSSLVLSSICFFVPYGIILLVRKNKIVTNLVNDVLVKIISVFRKKRG